MNERIIEAYVDYSGEQARAGILNHSLDIALLEGKTMEQGMIEVLRAAGRLPEGWEGDAPSQLPTSANPLPARPA